jgi:hypothetical protein
MAHSCVITKVLRWGALGITMGAPRYYDGASCGYYDGIWLVWARGGITMTLRRAHVAYSANGRLSWWQTVGWDATRQIVT